MAIVTRSALRRQAPSTPPPATAPAGRLSPVTDPLHPISVLQSQSLPALVQKELEQMILLGELTAGDKLSESAVAEMLGVSRGPVREAFRALEEVGLVQFEKNRGVYVRQVSLHEADQIYEVRAALDGFVGRKLARTVTPAQVKTLREIVGRMERAASAGEVENYYRLNIEFHETLVAFTGNEKLALTYRRLVNELNLFRRSGLSRPGILPASFREHRDIVEHIASGDAEAASVALEAHAHESRARMHRMHDPGRPLAARRRSRK
jgi:phosphonate utilization transcriptional regulator